MRQPRRALGKVDSARLKFGAERAEINIDLPGYLPVDFFDAERRPVRQCQLAERRINDHRRNRRRRIILKLETQDFSVALRSLKLQRFDQRERLAFGVVGDRERLAPVVERIRFFDIQIHRRCACGGVADRARKHKTGRFIRIRRELLDVAGRIDPEVLPRRAVFELILKR